jgi:threonine dehydrogenase-like Zn-dependent dehydrogenase
VFDAVGTQDSLDKAVRLAAPNSEICIIGIPEVDLLEINPHQMRVKELRLVSSRRSNQQLEKAYRIFVKDTTAEKMVTHRFELQDIQKAFEISSGYQDGVIKTMIVGSQK